jgi:uroporphyrinogen-III decarboxylase
VCFPIATDLDLHEEAEPEAVRADPERLGRMLARSARRYRIPMAMPLMDLRLDKAALLAPFGLDEQAAEAFQFTEIPDAAPETITPKDARAGAIEWLRNNTDLAPVGLAIGPFSLATKLMRDPISAIALAGEGEMGDPMVRLWEWCLERARAVVRRSLLWQVDAGARTMILCEPAVNSVYLSPRQIKRGSAIFADYALTPMREMKQVLSECGASLFLHDCGELTKAMVEAWAADIHPAVLSLGSSRTLCEDEALVPDDVVMYGNLPTKLFYSDDVMPEEEVARRAAELCERMAATGHPFLLGSECDVLYVPDCAERIRRKVDLWANVEAG